MTSFSGRIKKSLRWFFYSLLSFIGVVVLYLVAGALLTIIPVNTDFEETPDGIPLFLRSNGFHAEICFPLEPASSRWDKRFDFSQFESTPGERKYISIGWGDREFFANTPTWDDLTVGTALRAGFIPTASALHITLLPDDPIQLREAKMVMISEEQLQIIENYMLGFVPGENEPAIPITTYSYPEIDDMFFESKGKYTLLNTCNNWINKALKKAGIKTATWAPFDRSVLYHFD